MAEKLVKWDSKGNPVVTSKTGGVVARTKRRLMKFSLSRVVKEDTAPIVGGVIAGAVAVGVGAGLVSVIPPLRRWAVEGSALTRGLIIGGTSLGVAGIGLAVYAKAATPKKAMAAALPVLGSVIVLVAAPSLSAFIVEKIDNLISGLVSAAPVSVAGALPAPSGTGPVPRMRPRRRALSPDEVLDAVPRARQARSNLF